MKVCFSDDGVSKTRSTKQKELVANWVQSNFNEKSELSQHHIYQSPCRVSGMKKKNLLIIQISKNEQQFKPSEEKTEG